MKLPAARIPAGISAPIATLIGAGMLIANEASGISHPLHQAIIAVGGFALAILGYFTEGGTPAIAAAETGPPFAIPDPLPVSSVQTTAAENTALGSRAAIDAAAASEAQRSLP
jgi:hypothetical protein